MVLVAILVSSCGVSEPQKDAPVTERIGIESEIVAYGEMTNIYKFTDGSRVCYFVEPVYFTRSPGGIWCTP